MLDPGGSSTCGLIENTWFDLFMGNAWFDTGFACGMVAISVVWTSCSAQSLGRGAYVSCK